MSYEPSEPFMSDMRLVGGSQFVGVFKDEARQRVQDRINEVTKELRALNSLHNELAPIHILADELMSEIFLYVQAVGKFPDIGNARYKWLRLSWVCRHWRNVALRFQLLWTSIEASNIEIAETFLQRSGTAPVDFHLSSMFKPVDMMNVSNYIDMIARHATHISHLSGEILDRDAMKRFVDEVGSIPFSNLRRLELCMLRDDFGFGSPSEILHPFKFRHPQRDAHLRVLKLNHIAFDWKPLSGTHLRHLILRNDRHKPCSYPSTDDFVNVLESCTQLEEIRLHWQGPALGSHPSRAVKLNNLRHLSVQNSPLVIAHILTHIDCPAFTKIQLFCELDEHFSSLGQILPRSNSLKVLPTITDVSVEETYEAGRQPNWPWHAQSMRVECSGDHDGELEIVLKLADERFVDWNVFSAMVFRSLTALLSLSPVKEINIRSSYTNFTQQDWYTVLAYYSSTLKHLILDYEHDEAEESAILTVLDLLGAPQDETEPPICPNLIALHLAGVTGGLNYARAVTDCIRSRFERGYKFSYLHISPPVVWCGNGRWERPDLAQFVVK